MRILILCTKYSLTESDGWLTNDLAAAFSEHGHEVTVVCLDWTGASNPTTTTMYGKVSVVNVPASVDRFAFAPRVFRNLYKWFFSSHDAISYVDAHVTGEFDLLIGFSPAATTYWLQRHLIKKCRPGRRYMVLWDFFPRSNAELGLVPRGPIYYVAKKLEARAIDDFHVVGLMSPANVKFMAKEFSGFKGRSEVLPLWGPAQFPGDVSRDEVRDQFGLPKDAVIAVFGGQLTPGRGIELLLRVADASRDALPRAYFVVAGRGPLEGYLTEQLKLPRYQNVRFLGQIPRNRYLDFLTVCDIGLVFSSGALTVPSFPSKTIDYFRAAVPVLGAVEAATDFSHIIETEIGAGYSSTSSDFAKIMENLEKLVLSARLRAEMGQRGLAYFKSRMTASAIVTQILGA